MKNNTVPSQDEQKLIAGMSCFLADTYHLYLKTQNFHWNVRGLHFPSLHQFFEEQYEALADAVDLVAERIRTLKAPVSASFSAFLKLTSLEEAEENLSAEQMLKQLLHDHDVMKNSITILLEIAQEMEDEGTADLLVERLREHEKTAWMLRSTLGSI